MMLELELSINFKSHKHMAYLFPLKDKPEKKKKAVGFKII